MSQLTIYTDGLCEPKNPRGHACWGWVALQDSQEIASGYGYLGHGRGMSNNVAEYQAAIEALRYCLAQGHRGSLLCTDSQLVTNQANGSWACIAPHLQKLLAELRKLLQETGSSIVWIPRERNTRADALSHRAYAEVACDREREERAREVHIERRGSELIANGRYVVDPAAGTCTCPDFFKRRLPCKHLLAAKLYLEGRA